MQSYISKGFIADNKSIYNEIKKLEPGSWLHFKKYNDIDIIRYWSLNSKIINPDIQGLKYFDAKVLLEQLLHESVRLRLISDVPFGVF